LLKFILQGPGQDQEEVCRSAKRNYLSIFRTRGTLTTALVVDQLSVVSREGSVQHWMAQESGPSRGKHETELLRITIEDQLKRLLTQLQDLDELKEGCTLAHLLPITPLFVEFEESEWQSTREETLQQLREFEEFLKQSIHGDMTLVNEFGAAQLAIQAAISEAFKTPEVIRMFANKQPDQLRNRLAVVQRELKLKHISKERFNQEAVEILIALKRLGTELSEEEKQFLEKMSSARYLESAVDNLGSTTQSDLMSQARTQIKTAEK